MSIYLICLTTNGGLPIFTRKKGDCDNLPFSTIASLNGFHMFFKSLGVTLHCTYCEEWTYLWRDFHNAITIIIGFSDIEEHVAVLLSELVYGAFSLFISRDDFAHSAILERLKKESKHYLPLVDATIDAAVQNRLFGYSDCILSHENALILQRLNEVFSVQCSSLFCCFLMGHCVVAATDGWWDLHIVDRQLLITLVQTSNSVPNDIAVYLPKKSPNIAYRFVTVAVSTIGILCVICGTEPSLKVIQDIAQNTFRNDWNPFLKIDTIFKKCVADYLELNIKIETINFANAILRKGVFFINQESQDNRKNFIDETCTSLMSRSLFDQAQSHVRLLQNLRNKSIPFAGSKIIMTTIYEQYWSSENHNYYVVTDINQNMLCLFSTTMIPIHLIRNIANKIYLQLCHEKLFCW